MQQMIDIFSLIQKPIVALLILGIIVFVHELGHFLVAKWCGVGVLDFAIGFGKVLVSWVKGDTKYSIRLIPLGGFVRMVGDDFRMRDAGFLQEELNKDLNENEQNLLKDKSKWFLEKNYFQKFAIVVAGPLFNLIFAFLLTVATKWHYGDTEPVNLPKLGSVQPDYPATKAGLEVGDLVVSINGKNLSTWEELATIVAGSEGKELLFNVKKPSGVIKDIKVTGIFDPADEKVLDGLKPTVRIGVGPDLLHVPITFTESLQAGYIIVTRISVLSIKGLIGMFRGFVSPKQISGPLFIMKEAANTASQGLERVLSFMIFLSISLAVLNLLPIPVLDGGHLLMFTIEAIKGSPLSMKVYQVANNIGMLFLLSLMLFAMSNDIGRFLGYN